MARERTYAHTINISNSPEMVRLTEEARKARGPIRLTIDDRDVGVLLPPDQDTESPSTRTRNALARPNRTHAARLLAGFGAVTPRSKPEDWHAVRQEVEQAIAREAMRQD